MARRRRRNESASASKRDEAESQLNWARYCARIGGLLGADDAEPDDYMQLTTDELYKLAEKCPDNGATGQVLKHLKLAEEARQS